MFMQKIDLPRVTCDLFGVTKGFDGNGGAGIDRGNGPRVANMAEAEAYADFIRRKNGLPDLGKPRLRNVGGYRGRTCAFHYVGATYGQEMSRGEYEPGAYSVLFPGANQMRAAVTLETLDEAGEVISSQTMPVEPKKGGVVWSKDDVRQACGPVAKVKAARTPTRVKRGATPTHSAGEANKRRRAVLMALRLRKRLRRAEQVSADRFREIARLTREDCAMRPDTPETAPDAILSDLAAAEALMRGEGYVRPTVDEAAPVPTATHRKRPRRMSGQSGAPGRNGRRRGLCGSMPS